MDNIINVLEKLVGWLSLPKMKAMDFVEIVLIAVLFYYVIKWIKTTRAWVIVKGLIVLLLVWILSTVLKFDVILWLFTNTIGVGITVTVAACSIVTVARRECRNTSKQHYSCKKKR